MQLSIVQVVCNYYRDITSGAESNLGPHNNFILGPFKKSKCLIARIYTEFRVISEFSVFFPKRRLTFRRFFTFLVMDRFERFIEVVLDIPHKSD